MAAHRLSRAAMGATPVLSRLLPHKFLKDKATRRMVHDFADRAGMVYFGYVNQQDDEHHILRGLTLSTKHRDDHYCIGTYHDYDVVFVERTDTILSGHSHTWHILEFDLKTKRDIPHFFIGSSAHGHGFHSLLGAKYPHLMELPLGATGEYPRAFTNHFRILAVPGHGVKAEYLIPPETAKMIGEHFKGLVVEVTENALYIYSEKQHLSGQLLDTMMANGVWLAAKIDENAAMI